MKVVIAGTYHKQVWVPWQMQLMNSVERPWMKCITLTGLIIDYFFCDGDADFIAIAEIPSREVHKGMLNNALATGSTTNLRSWYEIDLSAVTESQRKARNTFKPITE